MDTGAGTDHLVVDAKTPASHGSDARQELPSDCKNSGAIVLGNFGGSNYVAVGIPSRIVDAETAGQVELYRIEATGELISPPSLTLNDAQPEANQQFGRQVATMKFNNQQILVVGAKGEIFAYYKTALYDALPQ